MLGRYLKAQLTVLLFGGLVGPIFLIVYFALGPMARPYINWMFWVGLLVTAADVLAALALTGYSSRAAARHDDLMRRGVLAPARITGIADTRLFVNDQQMIKVNLHIDVPGGPGFDVQETMASSPARMRILAGHTLVALVEPGTRNYEIDWDASALVSGALPATFTLDEDNTTYDLTGRGGPLMEILRVLHAHHIPLGGAVDVRSNPAVRRQIADIVRRAAAEAPAPPPVPTAPVLTVSERLRQLEILHATGSITEAEYTAKRQAILAEL